MKENRLKKANTLKNENKNTRRNHILKEENKIVRKKRKKS